MKRVLTDKLKYLPVWIMGVTLLCAGIKKVHGQEQAFFSQHRYNPMLYNPAFAGNRDIPGFSIYSRQQWISWEGSPSSNMILAHTRMKNKDFGLGFTLAYDRMGPVQQTGVSGAYAYSLQITGESRLMMGLQAELKILQIHLMQLQLIDQGDQLFEEDPGMKFQPNVGIGFNYIFRNYSVSLSIPRILYSNLSPFQGETSYWSKTRRILYMGANTSYKISGDLKVLPSLLVGLASGHSPFIEMAGLLQLKEKFGLGALYRFNKTVGGMIRYDHQETFVFGYSYDISLGYTQFNAGTHELYLGYNFPFNQTKTLSPRRF